LEGLLLIKQIRVDGIELNKEVVEAINAVLEETPKESDIELTLT